MITVQNHNQNGLVSIIIPCYNSTPWIGEAIESCLQQTYPLIEIIVVDDGSTDDSLKIIETYQEKVIYRTGPNRGACHARNWGFSLSSGSYIQFFDADDLLMPDCIEAMVNGLTESKFDLAACPWWILQRTHTGNWKSVEKKSINPPSGDFTWDWLMGWSIPPCAMLWTREAFLKTGGWDETLKANQDGDITLRALLNGAKIIPVEKGGAYYRRLDKPTIASSRSLDSFMSRMRVFEKIQARLEQLGLLQRYSIPLGRGYFKLAHRYAAVDQDFALTCITRAYSLAAHEAIIGKNFFYYFLSYLLGAEQAFTMDKKFANFRWDIGLQRQHFIKMVKNFFIKWLDSIVKAYIT